MGCCLKIALRNIPSSTPAHYFAPDGNVYLDPPKSFQVSDNAAETNKFGQIKESGVIDSDLPKTQRNKWAVRQYDGIIPVRIMIGGIELFEDQIFINGQNSSVFDCNFKRTTHFLEFARSYFIRDAASYQPYIFSESHVTDIQTNHRFYTGLSTDAGYWFPLAYYGGLFRNTGGAQYEHTFIDYRPWFHSRKILDAAFCNGGFKFSDELLNSAFGSGIITYQPNNFAVGNKLEKYPGTNESNYLVIPGGPLYQFKATKTTSQNVTFNVLIPVTSYHNVINFNNEVYDTGGTLGGSGFYTLPVSGSANSGIRLVCGKWSIKGVVKLQNNTASPITVWLFLETGNYFADGWINQHTPTRVYQSKPIIVTIPAASTISQAFDFDTVGGVFFYNHAQPAHLTIFNPDVTFPQNSITVLPDTYIEGEAIDVYVRNYAPATGTSDIIIFPQSYISPTMTLYDYLAGIIHLTNGKINVDRSLQFIRSKPPESRTLGANNLNGYYDGAEVDLTPLAICDSLEVANRKSNVPCKVVVSFKDSTDPQIEKTYGDRELYAKEVDMSAYTNECTGNTETYENPLFEPTGEALFYACAPSAPYYPVSIPFVLDNTEGNMSIQSGPRIMKVHNYNILQLVDNTNVAAGERRYKRYWGGVSGDTSFIPYATQVATYYTNSGGVPTELVGLAYGGGSFELWEFYKSEILGKILSDRYLLKVICPNIVEYVKFDFRNKYFLAIDGAKLKLRLASKGPFDPCESNTVELELESREYIC